MKNVSTKIITAAALALVMSVTPAMAFNFGGGATGSPMGGQGQMMPNTGTQMGSGPATPPMQMEQNRAQIRERVSMPDVSTNRPSVGMARPDVSATRPDFERPSIGSMPNFR